MKEALALIEVLSRTSWRKLQKSVGSSLNRSTFPPFRLGKSHLRTKNTRIMTYSDSKKGHHIEYIRPSKAEHPLVSV